MCGSSTSSSPTRRVSADCEPERSTANSFSCEVDGRRRPPSTSTAAGGVQAVDRSRGRSRSTDQPTGRWDVRPSGWAGARRRRRPRCAALMRSAASLDTIVVGPSPAWPSAAPMMRLSGTSTSRPCSISRCFWMPLISICSVPSPTRHRFGERAAVQDAQLLDRAQRGASRPADVVGPGLQAVELLDDRERDDTSTSPNVCTQCGSAISTEVSSTIRVLIAFPSPLAGCPPPAESLRASLASRAWSFGRRSVTVTPDGSSRPAGG